MTYPSSKLLHFYAFPLSKANCFISHPNTVFFYYEDFNQGTQAQVLGKYDS